MLLSAASPSKSGYIREWECDLQSEFTEAQLHHLYQLINSSSLDTKTHEKNYKLLTRWYWMATTLTWIYPSASDHCWGGSSQQGTLLHILWECPRIRPFWREIRDRINDILEDDLPLLLVHFLLHVPTVPLTRYRCSVLPHLLNMAKRCLPIHWNRAHIPSREDWIKKSNINYGSWRLGCYMQKK